MLPRATRRAGLSARLSNTAAACSTALRRTHWRWIKLLTLLWNDALLLYLPNLAWRDENGTATIAA